MQSRPTDDAPEADRRRRAPLPRLEPPLVSPAPRAGYDSLTPITGPVPPCLPPSPAGHPRRLPGRGAVHGALAAARLVASRCSAHIADRPRWCAPPPLRDLLAMRERTPSRAPDRALPNLRLLSRPARATARSTSAAPRGRGITVCGTPTSAHPDPDITWGLIPPAAQPPQEALPARRRPWQTTRRLGAGRQDARRHRPRQARQPRAAVAGLRHERRRLEPRT